MALRPQGAVRRIGLLVAAASLATGCGPAGTPRSKIVNARPAPGAPAAVIDQTASTQVSPTGGASRESGAANRPALGTATTLTAAPAPGGAAVRTSPTTRLAASPTTTPLAPAVAGGAAVSCGPTSNVGPAPQCPPG